MVLSKREKYIGIGVIAAVALLGIDSLIVSPYFDRISELRDAEKQANKTLNDDKLILHKQNALKPQWQELLGTGLEADYSVAQSQTQQALQAWARSAGIAFNSVNSEGAPTQRGVFQIINFNFDFNAVGQPSMREIANLIWSLESANIPIRLNDLKIQSTREGTDQLAIKMMVSVLYMPPAAPSAGRTGSVAGGTP